MKGPLYGGLFYEYQCMILLIILLVVITLYAYSRWASSPPVKIPPFKFKLTNGKVELKSVLDIASLLYSRGEELKGLSADEVEQVMERFKTRLPLSYREFLLYMGRGAGGFMLGSSVFIDELYDLREGVRELCEENGIPHIPENAFVFWMHQGYQALYFIPEEGVDDPDIYYYTENSHKNGFEKTGHSFTYFLRTELVWLYPDLKDKLLNTGNPEQQ